MSRRQVAVLATLVAVVTAVAGSGAAQAGSSGAPFSAGAAVADFTPPPFGKLGHSDPADCIAGTPLEQVYNGSRPFAFEEPYVDVQHINHYVLGDPFVDCNHDGRWDGNLIGGGTNNPRYYQSVADAVTARALAVKANGRTTVVEVVDQEGLFNIYQERIRQRAAAVLAARGVTADDVFISATHDESAPDTLGLGGVNQVTSGTNEYFVDFLIEKAARAIEDAVTALRPAHIRYAEAVEPHNLRQCWSSYPYVDDQLMPTLQAVSNTGAVIATLTSVSQHAETLGFNPNPTEASWLSADWPNFFRNTLQQRYGGVAIEMAGSVGSNETPEIFSGTISGTPQQHIDASHPAGCNTLFEANGTQTPTGYSRETEQLGNALAGAVASALDHSATWSKTNTLWGARASVCVPLSNDLFLAAAAAGVFGGRPGYAAGCTVESPVAPNGSTGGESILTQVAAFRIGDGEFAAVPGEVFPFTYLGSFLGPQDMPDPKYPMTPLLMAHMHAPYRFIDGLAEDMAGYIFPQGNGVGVPGETPLKNQFGTSDTDRFGCGHSDDAESANSATGDLLGRSLVNLLDRNSGHPRAPEQVVVGRYVLRDGSTSRSPLGRPESLQCNQNARFAADGPAAGVWLPGAHGGTTITPAAWLSLSGRAQPVADRNTRGWIDPSGSHHWLDVFPDLAGVPARVVL